MIKKWATSVDFYNLLQVVIYWPKWHKTDHKRVKTTYLLAKTNPMAYLLAKTTEIIQMATFNDFGNTAEQIKTFCAAGGDTLTPFQTKMVENHLTSLGSNVSHQLIMAVLESRDPTVLAAVKGVSQALGLHTDFSYAEVVIKGN